MNFFPSTKKHYKIEIMDVYIHQYEFLNNLELSLARNSNPKILGKFKRDCNKRSSENVVVLLLVPPNKQSQVKNEMRKVKP